MSDLLPDRLKIFGLIHDGGEALTSDCPNPFKTDDFRTMEHRIMERLYADLDLPALSDEDRALVKDADSRALLGEIATIAPTALRNAVTARCPEAETLTQKYLKEYSFDDLLRPDGRAVQEFIRRFQVYRSHLTDSGSPVLSASTNPRYRPLKIYVAGKIDQERDFRHTLVDGLLTNNADEWHRMTRLPIDLDGGAKAFYVGPFPFVFEWNSSKDNWHSSIDHTTVYVKDKEGINSADLFIVWADEKFGESYGTLVEVGIAAGLGKPVVLIKKSDAACEQQWFARECAGSYQITSDNPVIAIKYLLECLEALRAMHGDLPVRELLNIPIDAAS